jgi:curli biogenesis system outer membrane secretion channel CsgG
LLQSNALIVDHDNLVQEEAMKNILTAIVIGIALAGISYAQAPARVQGVKTAVVEFSVGPNAAGMTEQAKFGLQTQLSARLNHTRKFDVYDTRHTRRASQADLGAINGASTSAAVRLGKQVGVAYVVTGHVEEYNTSGSAKVKFRLVEVATGKVKYSGEISQQAVSKMTGNGSAAEMQAKVMKPIIDKVTEELRAGF